MATVVLRGIEKAFGTTPVLRGVDLKIEHGSFTVLVGPSGCGKSTLLRTIAGLEAPDRGSVSIGERNVTTAAPRERDVAMVFQSYALYPHLTVRDNIAFGMRLRGEARATIDERIAEIGRMLNLEKLLDRFPRQLSGGQRQRVAMGRAVARRPAAFLFDEPLSNLDPSLRSDVRVQIKRLHTQLGATMIYVTHDQVEALTLADRLVVLHDGRIEQEGAPLDVYRKPASKFVASFLGSPPMNFLEGTVREGIFTASGVSLSVNTTTAANVLAGIRPHDVSMGPSPAPMEMAVEIIEHMGPETFAHGTIGGQRFVARLPGDSPVAEGDRIGLRIAAAQITLFDPSTHRAVT